MKMTESQRVAAVAWRVRHYALQMGEVQGQGYIGQALGCVDVPTTAFSYVMTYRSEGPEWKGYDRFLLSHGHYAIIYYAVLLETGIIPEVELEIYGSDSSRLLMFGMATYTSGMEIFGDSLGQGLSIAVDMTLGLRQRQSTAWVYSSMPDGGLDEGSTWGTAMPAAHYGLGNLINLVDVNKQQVGDDSRKILDFKPLQDKWAVSGWYVQRVDNNDLPAVMAAFDNTKSYPGNQPRVILCDTLVDKGVPFLETYDESHFIRVDADEWQGAIAALDANKPEGVL